MHFSVDYTTCCINHQDNSWWGIWVNGQEGDQVDDEDKDNDGCVDEEDYIQYMPDGRGADAADADLDEIISLKRAAEVEILPQHLWI